MLYVKILLAHGTTGARPRSSLILSIVIRLVRPEGKGESHANWKDDVSTAAQAAGTVQEHRVYARATPQAIWDANGSWLRHAG
jgi:hypothetical protein